MYRNNAIHSRQTLTITGGASASDSFSLVSPEVTERSGVTPDTLFCFSIWILLIFGKGFWSWSKDLAEGFDSKLWYSFGLGGLGAGFLLIDAVKKGLIDALSGPGGDCMKFTFSYSKLSLSSSSSSSSPKGFREGSYGAELLKLPLSDPLELTGDKLCWEYWSLNGFFSTAYGAWIKISLSEWLTFGCSITLSLSLFLLGGGGRGGGVVPFWDDLSEGGRGGGLGEGWGEGSLETGLGGLTGAGDLDLSCDSGLPNVCRGAGIGDFRISTMSWTKKCEGKT